MKRNQKFQLLIISHFVQARMYQPENLWKHIGVYAAL